MSSEVLIGRGRTGKVYKIDGNPESGVRKEFSLTYSVKLWNWFFYRSPHPLSTEAGRNYAYWKRRVAHRLAEYSDADVHIVDALEPLYNGFVSPFIDGNKPKKKERQATYSSTACLEDFFDDIGMPTWSFAGRNPF